MPRSSLLVLRTSKLASRRRWCYRFAQSYSTHVQTGQASPGFDPEDGKAVFAGSSTARLALTWSMLSLCQYRFLVEAGTRVLGSACQLRSSALRGVVLWPVRKTAFAHFCGGENLEESVSVARQLQDDGVRCIVDWGVEESCDATAWDVNAQNKADILHQTKEALADSAASMPLKLTALLSPGLLERITSIIDGDASALQSMEAWQSKLTESDAAELAAALQRLRHLCQAAKKSAIPLLLDAEQSNRQPAVHLIARQLQQEFNVGDDVVVYDTLQMYLKAAPGRLEDALAAAKADGYTCAVKLVRGAYIEQEGPLGVCHDSKEDTHRAYNAAACRLLLAIADEGTGTSSVSLLLATHNRASLQQAVDEMKRLGLARDDKRVQFAQILGMVDNLTTALGLAGYNVSKLVVFGEIAEVLPWLLRRIQENRDAFGAQAAELHVLRRELHRRLSM